MWGGRAFAFAAVALLLPLAGAGLVGGVAPPAQGACTQSAEASVGSLRLNPYNEDPAAGAWRTWLVDPADIYVPPPPGALSGQAAQERAELLALAATRAPWQEDAARRWDDGPASGPWDELLFELLPSHTGVDTTMNPPRLARDLAIFEAAMHDALVIAWKAKYCYQRAAPYALDPGFTALVAPRQAPSYPSEHAVAAGVASVVLPTIFTLAPAASFESLAREAAESRVWAGANFRSDVEAGLALGRQVARLALAARADDGSAAVWDGARPPSTNCSWSPTPPAFRQDPAEPLAGTWRPWLMSRGDQFRPPPPPACDSEEYVAQARELYEKSKRLTAAERAQAIWYDAGPGNEMPPGFELHQSYNLSRAHHLSTMQHVRVQSTIGAAIADAGIAAWDAKFTYWGDRPVHTIRRMWEPAWTPMLVTPPFPGYISGHSTFAGATEVVLKHFFPDDAAWIARNAADNAYSRMLGGVHVNVDDEVGLAVGRQVGALAVARVQGG